MDLPTINQDNVRPEDLMTLAPEEFASLVNLDLRHLLRPDLRSELRTPRCADRWLTALRQVQLSVFSQLQSRSERLHAQQLRVRVDIADLERKVDKATGQTAIALRQMLDTKQTEADQTLAEYLVTRRKTQRFLAGLQETLLEAEFWVRATQATPYDVVLADERDRYRAEVARLQDAILKHRERLENDQFDADVHDIELWAALNESVSV